MDGKTRDARLAALGLTFVGIKGSCVELRDRGGRVGTMEMPYGFLAWGEMLTNL